MKLKKESKIKSMAWVVCATALGMTVSGLNADLTSLAGTGMGAGRPAILSVIQSGFAACNETVYVTGDKVRYRTSPDILSNNIGGEFSKGTKLTRVGKTAEWSAVLVNGAEKYIASQYLIAS